MADASLTFFGVPAVVAAAVVTGGCAILSAVLAAKVGKRKPHPDPMPTATFGYAFPGNGPQPRSTGAKVLRQASMSLFVATVVLSLIVYVQYKAQAQESDGTSDASIGTTSNSDATTAPDEGASGEPVEEPLAPTAAKAVAVQDFVNLTCPPHQRVTYTASNLIDQNPDTAWWASSGDDASGKFAVITFASAVHLTTVGLVPGYTNQLPRRDQDCRLSSAFPHNRFVVSVRYDFDDGKSVIQNFRPEPRMQTVEVDSSTKNVRITILRTRLPVGADNDTLISGTTLRDPRPIDLESIHKLAHPRATRSMRWNQLIERRP